MSEKELERMRKLYDALKRITKYQTPERLHRTHWKQWGLEHASEAIEYAYENVLFEAKAATKGMRRP